MKKYILILFAIATAITSCTNDDITISRVTNFKINPATVIEPFTWENNPGDLQSFDTNYQLRIRLLIYDSEGILQAEDAQYFSNYAVMMNSSLPLAYGSYTAIAITDLVGISSDAVDEFWHLRDYQRLADTRIDDAGYIGGKTKILGISKQAFSIKEDDVPKEITIDVQSAGAVFFVSVNHIRTYSDVQRYTLACNRVTEGCLFNADGSYTVIPKNDDGSYKWRITYFDVEDYSGAKPVGGYYYILPTSNLGLKFKYSTSEGSSDLTKVITINPKAGEEWAIVLDLKDDETGDITYHYGKLNSPVNRANILPELKLYDDVLENNTLQIERQSLYLKDIK